MMASGIEQSINQLLVCPLCKGELEFRSDAVLCGACGMRFAQAKAGYFDLFPRHLPSGASNRWIERQSEMVGWYQDLIATPLAAEESIAYHYAPLASQLVTLSGRILDLGGGHGAARQYLPYGVEHIVIDPSLNWLGAEWGTMTEYFPRLKEGVCFIRGVGEYLPFPARTFDAVLAFWSLNHTSDPEQVFREVQRVLRPGGRLLAVLEDMEPTWYDLVTWNFLARGRRGMAKLLPKKFQVTFGGREWPLQSDHLRIHEADVQRWSAHGFKVLRRYWVNNYLTYDLQRTS